MPHFWYNINVFLNLIYYNFNVSIPLQISRKNHTEEFCIIHSLQRSFIYKNIGRHILRSKITKVVFETFSDNRFAWTQVFINTSSLLNWRSTVIKSLSVRNKLVSSANIIVFDIEDTLFKSFMYRRIKLDPIWTPAGRHKRNLQALISSSLIWTILLSVSQVTTEVIQCKAPDSIML